MAPLAVAGPALLGPHGFFTNHRTTILLALTALVAFVLVMVFAQWFARTWGWRRSASRLARYVAGGCRDLADPALALVRYWRSVRLVSRRIADPELEDLCGAALTLAETTLADTPLADQRGCWPYLVSVSSTEVRIGVTGRARRPAPSPWRVDSAGHWMIGRDEVAIPAAAPARSPGGRCLVAVGVVGDALVMLDVASLSPVGVLEGPADSSRRLAATMAAQIAAGATGRHPVLLVVTEGILPGYGGPTLSQALDELASQVAAPGHAAAPASTTVLVCTRPTRTEAARLAELTTRDQHLRVIVSSAWAGDEPTGTELTGTVWAGTRWRLVLDDMARLAAPELGFAADAAPIERGVARALRQRRAGFATSAPGAKPDQPPREPTAADATLVPVPVPPPEPPPVDITSQQPVTAPALPMAPVPPGPPTWLAPQSVRPPASPVFDLSDLTEPPPPGYTGQDMAPAGADPRKAEP